MTIIELINNKESLLEVNYLLILVVLSKTYKPRINLYKNLTNTAIFIQIQWYKHFATLTYRVFQKTKYVYNNL